MGGGGGGAAAGPEEIAGVAVLARILDGVGGKDLRPIAEEYKKQLPDGIIVLIGTADGKAAATVAVTGAAQSRFNAAELAKAAVLAMGGQGAAARPDFAQGGAPDASKAVDGLGCGEGGAGGVVRPPVIPDQPLRALRDDRFFWSKCKRRGSPRGVSVFRQTDRIRRRAPFPGSRPPCR